MLKCSVLHILTISTISFDHCQYFRRQLLIVAVIIICHTPKFLSSHNDLHCYYNWLWISIFYDFLSILIVTSMPSSCLVNWNSLVLKIFLFCIWNWKVFLDLFPNQFCHNFLGIGRHFSISNKKKRSWKPSSFN